MYDEAKNIAYKEACARYPDHRGAREWSLFLAFMADRMGTSHPHYDEFVRSSRAFLAIAESPNVPSY